MMSFDNGVVHTLHDVKLREDWPLGKNLSHLRLIKNGAKHLIIVQLMMVFCVSSGEQTLHQ